MGFGTLLIGYFFLVNITYFEYTDIIAAMIMLMGLYKLSGVNKSFRNGMISSVLFAIFSLSEIIITVISLFGGGITVVNPYIAATRYILIFVLTLFTLRGVREVADEVDASDLASTAKRLIPLCAIFAVAALFELPFISSLFGKIAAYIFFVLIVALFVYVLSVFFALYKAYMQICMPEDIMKEKAMKNSGGVWDKFFSSLEDKGREYAEYKLNKRIQKSNKKRKK